jgi:transposase
MPIELTDAERSQLQRFMRRPRSRKQLYRSEAILLLDQEMPVDTVARKLRVGVERVEDWMSRFERDRLKFLAEPREGRPRSDDADGRWERGREED